MIIQCTKSLLDKLPLETADLVPVEKNDVFSDNLFAWHANFITLDRKKAVVLMNNLAKYAIVLYRPKAKDWKKFEENVKQAIRTVFQEEGIKDEIIDVYLEKAGDFQYSKTAGRSILGSLNLICRNLGYYWKDFNEDQLIQPVLSVKIGNYLMKYGDSYALPSEQLFLALNRMMGNTDDTVENVLAIENYELKITLDLENFEIWRRIQMPSSCTFKQLHRTLQTVFGWLNYHLHDFRVLEKDPSLPEDTPLYAQPVKIRIVDGEDPEAMAYQEPDKYSIYRDNEIILHDIFSQETTCIYTYDFGDNWEHLIELEKVIPNSTNRQIRLLDRQGKRPPEDVGGESGFEEFMNIMADENDPEYDEMKRWSDGLSEKDCTIAEINRWLRL